MRVNNIEQLVNRILDGYSTERIKEDGTPTFLSVIGKSYNEEIISRIVAYCLVKDLRLIQKMYLHYKCSGKLNENEDADLSVVTDLSVICEKYMGKGRADIFASMRDAKNTLVTLTIENKIGTQEHSNQTQTYHDWVLQYPDYQGGCHLFFYLRPTYNQGIAECDDFLNITYDDFAGWLDKETDDPIMKDFLHHIQKKLGGNMMSFTETDMLILNNYHALQRAEEAARNALGALQSAVFDSIQEKLKAQGFDVLPWQHSMPEMDNTLLRYTESEGPGVQSYRLYRPQWYKADHYYLYAEIKFHDGMLNNISFQATLKGYSKKREINSDDIYRFVTDGPFQLCEGTVDQWYVLRQENWNNKNWGTEKWMAEFIETATNELILSINHLDEVFNKLKDFLGIKAIV